MKSLFVCMAAALVHTATWAQVTITDADFPSADYLAISGRDTSSFIGLGTPGASQTWDFSAYVPANSDTSHFTGSTFTGNPLFPAATFSSCAMAAGFSMCSYGYKTISGMYLVGAEQNISVTGMTIHNMVFMSPYNQFVAFPLAYTNSRSYTYKQEQIAEYTPAAPSDSVRTIYHRTVDQVCDGWGTLITPYGTYNALRLQQIQGNIDTTYNHAPGGAWTMGSTTSLSYDTTYTWFAPGIGTVATLFGHSPTRYSFYKPAGTTGMAAPQQAEVAAWPNPAREVLNVTNLAAGTDLRLSDFTGRIVYHTTVQGNRCTIDMERYAPGAYILQAVAERGGTVRYAVTKL